ncbi:MAG: YXWGXW repeat-containing protein [Rhodanobacteraceae bacterium]
MQTSRLALLIALACAGGAAVSVTPPASAQVGLSITVGTRPPPPRFERMPPPRPGYIWARGYWRWQHHRYVWVRGTWYRARPGYVYAPPRWVHRGNRWVYHASQWRRDPHWHHDHGHPHG